MKCTVCSTEIDKNYCSNCGQFFKEEKVSIGSVLIDLFGNIFSLEKSFSENIKIALVEPKVLILNYWNGFRRYYYSPSKFLMIASVFFFIQLMIGNDFFGIMVRSKVSQQFTLLIFNIVLFSVLSYITYLKYKRSFFEHLIMNIYIVSLWSIIFVPISIVLNIFHTPKTIETGFIILYLLCIMVWNSRVFDMKNSKRFIYIFLNCLLLSAIGLLVFKFGVTHS